MIGWLLFVWLGPLSFSPAQPSFITDQLRYERVREAKAYADSAWRNIFRSNHARYPPQQVYIRAFKYEKEFEVWVKDGAWKLAKTFTICKLSGKLGPKRLEGDRQVPEGFYHISDFNPNSSYYLSLKVNYPNAADQILSDKERPGGDIFVHGKCVTIGCLPMTDNGIKMIYWLCVLARNEGQERIPVSIFPCRLTDDRFQALKLMYFQQPALVTFWENLKEGFDYFEREEQLPAVGVNRTGSYSFQ
jgi:murein L,D-transpeptidase YafK